MYNAAIYIPILQDEATVAEGIIIHPNRKIDENLLYNTRVGAGGYIEMVTHPCVY